MRSLLALLCAAGVIAAQGLPARRARATLRGLYAPTLQARQALLELEGGPAGEAASHSAATGARGFAHDDNSAEPSPASTGGASRRRAVIEEEVEETETTTVQHKKADVAAKEHKRDMTRAAPAPGPRAEEKEDAAPEPRAKNSEAPKEAEAEADAAPAPKKAAEEPKEKEAAKEAVEEAAEEKEEAAPVGKRSRGRNGVEMAPARIEAATGPAPEPADTCPCNNWLVQHHLDMDLASQSTDDADFDAFFVHGRTSSELDALVAELEHARDRVRCKRKMVGAALKEKKEKEEEEEEEDEGDGSQSAGEIRAEAQEIRSATAALLARTAADSRAQKQSAPLIGKRDAAARAAAARYEREERDNEERSELHERSVQAAVDEAMREKKEAEGELAQRQEKAEEKAEKAEKAAQKAVQRAEADLADAKRQAAGRVSRAREAYDVSHKTAQRSIGDAEEQMGEARDREAASREQVREEQERLDKLREELAEERQQAA